MFTKLSSNSVLAPSKNINLTPFGLDQLGMMSGACQLKDPHMFLEAITSTVATHSPEELTIGDLLQIATYHRITCYPNNPIELSWTCKGILFKDTNTDEMLKLAETSTHADPENLEPFDCNSSNTLKYCYDNFPMVYLDETPELDDDLCIPNATLYPDMVILSQNPTLSKIIQAAAWIKSGSTIKDKLDILRRAETLDLFDRASIASKKYQHGPAGALTAACPNCDASIKRKVTIDQTSFFR